jgi:hypothetical protein
MAQFYIVDSVHNEAGFIIGACVCKSIDLSDKIINIINSCGYDPDIFEFKSSANFSEEPQKAKVREELKGLLIDSCRLGIVVIPRTKRDELGYECIKAINNSSTIIKSKNLLTFILTKVCLHQKSRRDN